MQGILGMQISLPGPAHSPRNRLDMVSAYYTLLIIQLFAWFPFIWLHEK